MAAIGRITLTSATLPAEPSSKLALRLPSVETQRFNPYAMGTLVDVPEHGGVLIVNGVDALRHVVTNVLRTGPLAPSAALTAAGTAARATATLTGTANLADGDSFLLRDRALAALPSAGYGQIVVQSALSAVPATHEVLLGASLTATLDNIEKLINGTGTHGTDYMDFGVFNGGTPWFRDNTDIECSSSTATVATFRANTYGTVGNGYTITEVTDSGAAYAVAAWSGGSAGTGTAPESGSYQYGYAYVREEDQAQTGLSPTAEIAVDGNGNVNLSVIATGPDSDMDIKRWFRTQVGGVTFWRGYDVATASTTDTDDVLDDDLDRFGNVSYDPEIHRPYEGGYPTRGRYGARFKGRYWVGGALLAADTPSHASWTLTLTNGSRSATVPGGSVAYLTSAMDGRALTVADAGLPYRIVYVNESTQTVYFDREWEGSSGDTAVVIKDDRDPYQVFYSEPNLINNWPIANSLRAIRSPSRAGIMGLHAIWESLIAWTPTGVWRITGDGPFAVHQDAEGPGCLSGHSVVEAEGRLYWLGPDGFYEWSGADMPRKISSPPLADANDIQGIDRTFSRLSLAHAHRCVGAYDEVNKAIRWYVPLDGDDTCRYAMVYELQTATWSIDTCEDVTCAGTVAGPDGARVHVTGDVQGALLQTDVGTSDGFHGFASVATTDGSCTTATITVSGTPAYTSSAIGMPAWCVSATGDVTRQAVASATTGSLTIRREMTALSTGLQVAVGGIVMDLETCWYHLGIPHLRKSKTRTRTYFDVQTTGQVFYGAATDQGTPTVRGGDPSISLALEDGERSLYVMRRGRHHKDRWLAVQGGFDVVLQGWRIETGAA